MSWLGNDILKTLCFPPALKVIDVYHQDNYGGGTTTSFNVNFKRHPIGSLVFMMLAPGGSTPTGIASGWTTLHTTTLTANNFMIQYRYIDGTEATSLSVAYSSSSGGVLVSFFVIQGASQTKLPTSDFQIAFSGTVDPPSVTASATAGSYLYFVYFANGTDVGEVTSWPIGHLAIDGAVFDLSADFGYPSTGSMLYSFRIYNLPTYDPSAFSLTTNPGSIFNCVTVCIPGAT